MAIIYSTSEVWARVGLILTLTGAVVFGGAFAFFSWHHVQPVHARSRVLVGSWWVMAVVSPVFAYFYSVSDNPEDYYLGQMLIGDGLLVFYLLRAFRLLLIFNLTEVRLEEEKYTAEHRWYQFWKNPKIVSEPYLAIISYSLYIILSMPIIVAGILAAQAGDMAQLSTSPLMTAGIGIVVVLSVIAAIFLVFKLRKVHDGYFFKTEFKIVATILVINCVIFFIGVVTPFPSYIIDIYLIFGCHAAGYGIPSYLAFKNYRELLKPNRSVEQSGSQASDSTPQTNTEEAKYHSQYIPFEDYPKVRKIWKDPLSMKFVKEFILHYQNTVMSDYLNCYTQLLLYQEVHDPAFYAGKGFLLYQKFFAPDAYRFINCCTTEHQKILNDKLQNAMKEENPVPVDNTLFNKIARDMENVMVVKLYIPFIASTFHEQYLEVSRLDKGMQEIVTK